jgi:aminoglycoside phosphotransferase (APT) family kinase protein
MKNEFQSNQETSSDRDTGSCDASSHPSIARALHATFARSTPDSIARLGGGCSGAAVYNLAIDGRRYMLRHERASTEENRAREFSCMRVAAERGIAPRVHYASVQDGVCITDFVQGLTLGESLRQGGGDYMAPLATLLRALHAGPAFPKVMTVPDACIAFGGALRSRAAEMPLGRELVDRVAEMRAALAPHIVDAPCHHDLNPGNILVEGDRLWLIDWNGACAGDAFHDVVTQAVFIYRTPEARAKWLRTYLERDPTPIEAAREVVTHAQALTFFAALFFAHHIPSSSAPPPPRPSAPADSSSETIATTMQSKSMNGGATASTRTTAATEQNAGPPDAEAFGAALAQEAMRAFESAAYARALDVLRVG